MSINVTATAAVQSWDEAPYDEAEGTSKTTKARVQYQYEGGITGDGVSEMLMVYVGESAEYLGLERVNATVDGRSGSFVVSVIGGFRDNEARWSWEIVPGSATGELEGLRGVGRAEAPMGSKATLTLDYDFA
jgi:Protein of unknown function (DUF3224)